MKRLNLLFILLYLFFTDKTYAQIGLDPTKQGNRGIKVTNVNNPEEAFTNVIRNTIVLLFTVGALAFIIMFVWGAVDWILSGGDKEKIAGARKRIVTAIIGLVLLALTFVV